MAENILPQGARMPQEAIINESGAPPMPTDEFNRTLKPQFDANRKATITTEQPSAPVAKQDSALIGFMSKVSNFWNTISSTSGDIDEVTKQNINKEISALKKEGQKLMPMKNKADDVFTKALLPSVLSYEGGYTNNPRDAGNYLKKDKTGPVIGTNKGISADALAKHLGRTPTVADMQNISDTTVNKIYKTEYYDKYKIKEVPSKLQELVFNAVVNSGNHGIKTLQNLLGLPEDGSIGPDTIKALKESKVTKQQYKDALLNRYRTFEGWKDFGNGWTDRFSSIAKTTDTV
tara:strand:- start:5998 stop:6867 length:870 start_codon:yes stop_codon:yes gene_type:complete